MLIKFIDTIMSNLKIAFVWLLNVANFSHSVSKRTLSHELHYMEGIVYTTVVEQYMFGNMLDAKTLDISSGVNIWFV